MKTSVAIAYLNPDQRQAAEALAQRLTLPLINYKANDWEEYATVLVFQDDILQLALPASPHFLPLSVDFLHGKIAHRCRYGGGRQQLLARAIGLHKHRHLQVLDVTAGLGSDAFTLAYLGASVTMLERNPIIAALLADGLQRAESLITSQQLHLELIMTDAKQYLAHISDQQLPQVIYLDPMFPANHHSALAKKTMRILRQIVGDDHDAEPLLQLALQKAKSRVVVKRARLDNAIPGPTPNFKLMGKSNRFDIYLTC